MRKKNISFITLLPFLCLLSVLGQGCRQSSTERGMLCIQLGDYVLAQHFFSQVLENYPGDFRARLGLGKALLQQAIVNTNDTQAWKEALTNLEAARTIDPSAHIADLLGSAWCERGRALLSFRDTVGALTALQRSLEYDAKNIVPLNLAGTIYFHLGEADKSEALFKKAIEIDSASAPAFFNLGMVAYSEGRLTFAHDAWARALTRAPKDEDILYWFSLSEKQLREAR